MSKSQIITDKLQELLALSEAEGEPNVACIIAAVIGARIVNDDTLLASAVRDITLTILLPKAINDKAISNLLNN